MATTRNKTEELIIGYLVRSYKRYGQYLGAGVPRVSTNSLLKRETGYLVKES